jgi:pyruvate dehydrogenase phosphatase
MGHSQEVQYLLHRVGNPVCRVDRATLPSNMPGEDRNALDLFPDVTALHRETSKSFWEEWADGKVPLSSDKHEDGKKDLLLFSAIDGHGGSQVAELVSKTLHPSLAWAVGKHKLGSAGIFGLKAWQGTGEDPISKIIRDT